MNEASRQYARIWSSGFLLGVIVGFLASGFFW